MYYIVDKVNVGSCQPYAEARKVAIFMLGCRLSEYIIIKSDEKGDRVYKPESGDIHQIEKELEAF